MAICAAIVFPTAALARDASAPAAGGEPTSSKRSRTRHQAPLALGPFTRPVADFHRAIRVEVKRLRAAERARLRRERREAFTTLPGGVSLATLDAIGACESGGDPAAVSADGTYRGKFQFDQGTWESVGGSGDPAAASEAEQDYRAALLYSQAGASPWPICG